jgi:EAL domain-containing protein (putative c-di-GMP-specific phosphodiesterase class I)
VLREARREAATWTNPLSIAVNLSPINFRCGDISTTILSILIETGLDPKRLEIEVTEGVLIADFTRAISLLGKIKALGVHIAMDDFGTGYSSLSYLQSFSFDKIKIDQTFVGNLGSNLHSAAIIRAIVGLGRALNLPVIAEGVETEAQRGFLVAEGCAELQGYLIGRPYPIHHYRDVVFGARPVAIAS